MAMKTTFTSGHYRRRVAGVLAHRLLERLYEGVSREHRDQQCAGGTADVGAPDSGFFAGLRRGVAIK